MIENTAFITNQQLHVENGIAGCQIIWGLIIVFIVAIATILSSKLGLGLLSAWPAFVLFFIFIKHYELGIICFVLSFSYQAPVVFDPRFGLSAVIRLDEIIFMSILPVWFLRIAFRQNAISYKAPLAKPLLFYVLIAFLSLLVRYDTINSTLFLNTATGFKGLGPLFFKLAEVVIGYFILTDRQITQRIRNNIFWCLPIVAALAVTLSFLITHGILPKDIVTGSSYDPTSWHTRFALFGNTSAWGVLLICYFFILLYTLIYFESFYLRILFLILLILCVDAINISGAKTAMIGAGIGLILLISKKNNKIITPLKIIIFIFIVINISIWSINQFATEGQKREIYRQLEMAYLGTGIKGFERTYHETSLGTRYDHWLRFGEAVKEEPELLVIGRGWHRRAVYETGDSLHNDLLTALHDLGIPGLMIVIWLYLKMFKGFLLSKNKKHFLAEKVNILRSMMQILVIILVASSFTSENLTLYPEIDVQFPFIVTMMAVTFGYLKKQFIEKSHYAIL